MTEPYDPPAPLSEPRPTDSTPIDPALLDPARDRRPFPWGTCLLVAVLLGAGLGLSAMMSRIPTAAPPPSTEKTPEQKLADVQAADREALGGYKQLYPEKRPDQSRWRIPIDRAMERWAAERERVDKKVQP
jgi:hypothetical protein